MPVIKYMRDQKKAQWNNNNIAKAKAEIRSIDSLQQPKNANRT